MKILIEKSRRLLTLARENEADIEFPIVLGKCPEGRKMREGDFRTPEGEYYICTKNEKSKYHLALGLSYPSPADADAALAREEITCEQHSAILSAHAIRKRPPWNTPLGGFIMIHGGGISSDWTAGCIAMKNEDIETLFSLCPMGTPVKIIP